MTTLTDQIKNKFLASLAEGIQKFPAPSRDLSQSISSCNACILSEQRKRVVTTNSFAQKKFFILADFPDKEDESAEGEVFSKNSTSSSLILKLLEKLNITEQSHLAFALKCNPERGIPQQGISLCAQKNLSAELRTVSPQIILCFGERAAHALSFVEGGGEGGFMENIFIFPSARELRDFPYWRVEVWKRLSVIV